MALGAISEAKQAQSKAELEWHICMQQEEEEKNCASRTPGPIEYLNAVHGLKWSSSAPVTRASCQRGMTRVQRWHALGCNLNCFACTGQAMRASKLRWTHKLAQGMQRRWHTCMYTQQKRCVCFCLSVCILCWCLCWVHVLLFAATLFAHSQRVVA